MTEPKTITIPCSEGNVEATRAGLGEPWEINYPWGSERFYGNAQEVTARIRANIRTEQTGASK